MTPMILWADVQSKKVKISKAKINFEELIWEIENQTNYEFLYSKDDVAKLKLVNINKEGKVEEILKEALKNTNLTYNVKHNTFVIVKNKKTNTEVKKEEKRITLKGVVKNTQGAELVGASVFIKGTTNGVSTDFNGRFTIKVKPEDKILVVSFIGYKQKEITIKDKKEFKVKMEEDNSTINEVVITGYEVIEKRKLTSSVVTVKGSDVVEPVATSIDQMLQGKIAGMNVMQQSSTPGVTSKIRIRGTSTIVGNREPVWVIDGIILDDPVPINNEDLNSLDRVNLIGNAISFLNPQDIDRIDILKDASATAIYGVKAANGVIVITTKKGKKGAPKISYSTNINVIEKPSYDKMFRMNSAERMDLSREMHERGLQFHRYSPLSVGYEGALNKLYAREYDYNQFQDEVKRLSEVNTDWYDELFRNSLSQSHYATLSGGTDKITYYYSLGYSDNKGSSKFVNYKQLTSRLNIGARLSDKVRINLGISLGNTKNDRPGSYIDTYEYAYNTSRAIPLYNEDGSPFFYENARGYRNEGQAVFTPDIKFNILDEIANSGNIVKNKNYALNFRLDWKIRKNINYEFTAGYSGSSSDSKEWYTEKSFKAQSERGLAYGVAEPENLELDWYRDTQLPRGGVLNANIVNSESITIRNSARWNTYINKHSLSARIGNEIRMSKYTGYGNTGFGYMPDRGEVFVNFNLDKYNTFSRMYRANTMKVTNRENRYLSFYGTASYSYDSRYILNFNIRTDGSDKFGQDEKSRFLPVWSISGRWNVAEEKFFDNQNLLNQFSIRGSYGVQGNVSDDQVPNLILKLGTIDDISEEFSSTLEKNPNKNLKWEKTESYNLGIDFSFLKNRINGSLELYKKVGTDQIVKTSIPTSNGASSLSYNIGNMENKGWDLTFSGTIIDKKDMRLSLSVSTGKNKNKLTKLAKQASDDDTYRDYLNGSIIKEGYSVNSFYAYQFDKLNEEGLPVFKNLEQVDKDGNAFTSPEQAYLNTFKYMGKREPDFNGGMGINFQYKNFNFSSQFSFSLGSKMRLNPLYEVGQMLPYPQQNMSSEFVNRWKKAGDENTTIIPRLAEDFPKLPNLKYTVASDYHDMYNNADIRVVSGDFLRCRSLSLGYNFDKSIAKKLGVRGVNLSAGITNLFVLKDSKLKGRDPEQVSFGQGVLPPQRTYSLSLNVNF
jgi:TonB-linked SusC/RagA family outer membrane protein